MGILDLAFVGSQCGHDLRHVADEAPGPFSGTWWVKRGATHWLSRTSTTRSTHDPRLSCPACAEMFDQGMWSSHYQEPRRPSRSAGSPDRLDGSGSRSSNFTPLAWRDPRLGRRARWVARRRDCRPNCIDPLLARGVGRLKKAPTCRDPNIRSCRERMRFPSSGQPVSGTLPPWR